MLFPYNTDAPIYFWPLVTVALVVVNTLVFVGTIASATCVEDIEAVLPYMLSLGNGLHPLQWLTANFLHADWMHLVGNMFGLWAFGLIVEGKIGWTRFCAVYLGLGVATMFIVQCLGMGLDGGAALGASGAIFGLMGVALIWAPENDVECFLLIFFRPITFSMTVWAMSILYFGLNFLILLFTQRAVSTEAIHLVGAVLGLGVGIVMLKQDWVDCENWDVFSVWSGRNTQRPEDRKSRKVKPATETLSPEDRAHQRATSLTHVRELLASDRPELALALYRKVSANDPSWHLPEPELRGLIVECLKRRQYDDALPLMHNYLKNYTDQAVPMRLKLAQVVLQHEQRPAAAKRIVAQVPDSALTDVQRQFRRKLVAQAERMIADGAIELADEV